MQWRIPTLIGLVLVALLPALGTAAHAEDRPAKSHGSLRGTVRGPDGKAVPGAQVRVWRACASGHGSSRAAIGQCFDSRGRYEVAATTETDQAGAWRIEGLETGELYGVSCEGPAGNRARSVWRYAFVGDAPPLPLTLRKMARLRGRLVDHAGKGVAGFLTVRASEPSDRGAHQQRTWLDVLQLATSKEGAFTIHATPGAELVISAFVPGLGWRQQDCRAFSDGDEIEIAVQDPKGATVTGTIRDVSGKPVAGAQIVIKTASGRRFAMLEPGAGYAVSDLQGRYRIAYLPSSTLTSMFVVKDGFLPLALPEGGSGPRSGTPLPVGRPMEVDLTLHPGRSIAGRILDEHGRPVPDAWVRFVRDGRPFARLLRADDARTDAAGRFSLQHLPVTAGHVSAGSATHLLEPDGSNGGRGYRVRPDAPEEIVDARIHLSPGATLGGRVVDRAGKPVGAAVVRMHYQHGSAYGSPIVNRSCLTDAEGRFDIYGLPRMKVVRVEVDAVGFAKREADLTGTPAVGGARPTIVLDRGGSVSGRVLDGDGKPLRGMPVRRPVSADVAYSDASGAYSLRRLPPGRHTLILAGPGSTVSPVQRIVELAEGGTAAGVDFRLPKPGPSGNGVLAGVVVDEKGRPVEGERVKVAGVSAPGREASTRTDAAGRFRVDELALGRYRVIAGSQHRRDPVFETGTLDIRLEVPSGDMHVLEGVVRDADGALVPSAGVLIGYQGDGPGVARHGVGLLSGRFRVAVPDSVHIVTVSVVEPRDGAGRRLDLVRKHVPGVRLDASPVEITLARSVGIRGTVCDAAGDPVPGFILRVALAGRGAWRDHNAPPAETDPAGRFSFRGLEPGAYRITGKGTPSWSTPEPITVVAPHEGVEIRVRRYGSLVGRLLDADGTPVVDVRAWAVAEPRTKGAALPSASQGGSRMFQARTDAQGRFELMHLPPEFLYTVRFNLPLHLAKTRFPPVLERHEAGGPEAVLRLVRGASVFGRVVDPAGNGLEHIPIHSYGPMKADGTHAQALRRQAHTDADGRFQIGPFPAGSKVTLRCSLNPVHRQRGMPWLAASVEGVAAGTKDVRIELPRGVALRGRVEGATPAELQHFRLTLKPEDGPGQRTFVFDGQSATFAFIGLAPGKYAIVPTTHRREMQLPRSTVVHVPTDEVVLTRLVYARVKGRLTGVDPRDFQARFYDVASGRKRSERRLTADGTFDLGRFVNDPGVLLITSPEGTHVVYLELTPSDTPLAVKAVKTKTIKGRIVHLPAKIRRGRIVARRGPVSFPGTVAEDGWFTIPGLPPGKWTLELNVSRPKGGTFRIPNPVKAGSSNVRVEWR